MRRLHRAGLIEPTGPLSTLLASNRAARAFRRRRRTGSCGLRELGRLGAGGRIRAIRTGASVPPSAPAVDAVAGG